MKIKTAIVVDDSKSARFALRKALESRQISVQAVDGAEACYALVAQEVPDAIFLDHVMPGINGLDALRHLRAQPNTARTPILLCSSHDTPDFIAEARALGATDVLVKPPSLEQLDQALRTLEHARTAEPATTPKTPPPIGQRVISALRDTLGPVPRKETAQIGAQIEGLRTQATQLQQRLSQNAVTDPQATLQLLLQRVDALERKVETRLNDLQATLETGLRQQSERLVRITEAARAAAVENAHVEAERTAAQTASNLSEQFVNSLIAALRAGSFKPLLQSTPATPNPPATAARPPA